MQAVTITIMDTIWKTVNIKNNTTFNVVLLHPGS